jgi:hypothetical protein
MDIALRAVHALRHFQFRHVARRFEITGLSGLDFRVARLRLQQRQPADLELGAGANHEIGVARARHQARARLDVMRVLHCIGRNVDAHLVAAQFLRQSAPFGFAGENIERGKRRLHGQHSGQHNDAFQPFDHDRNLSPEFISRSKRVRAMRAQAVEVLHERLVVGGPEP